MVDDADDLTDPGGDSTGDVVRSASPDPGSEEYYRQEIYRALSDPSGAEDVLVERLLALGCERLDVENGHVVEIDTDAGTHEIVAASGSDVVRVGDRTDLERTFCRRTIEDDELLAFGDAETAGYGDDPAFEFWELSCYIGARLTVRGELYGTVCFVGADPRDGSFTREERSFVDQLTWAIGQILERGRYEQRLDRKQELFELFVDEVSDYAIFVLDPTGRIATWNQGAAVLKGYDEDEILGQHFGRFYTDDDRERGVPAQLLAEARRSGRVEDEGWRVRADGSTFWALVTITALYDDDGEIRGFGKVTRDLTERRSAERRLAAEKELTDRALDTLDDLFFVIRPSGRIERVNERVKEVTGLTDAEISELDPPELFVPADRDRIEAALAEVLETGAKTVEGTLVTDDGRRRRYEFRSRRLVDEDDEVTGVVGIGRDITTKMLYAERLEVAQRVLRHNLRNELNVIQGWAETLAGEVSADDETAVEQIVETTDQLVQLTEKSRLLTELDEITTAEATATDPAAKLRAIADDFRAAYPDARIEVEIPAGGTATTVVGDRYEVAVVNALENALEHNPSAEPWVTVVLEETAETATVAVHDDGPVIPPVERRVLSEGGEEPLSHGSGLGLWLIHWAVRTVGGTVRFDTRSAGGNVVEMAFPTVDEE